METIALIKLIGAFILFIFPVYFILHPNIKMSSTKQVKLWKVYVTIVLSIMTYYIVRAWTIGYDIVYNIL